MFGSIFDPLGIVVGVILAEDKKCLELIRTKVSTFHSVVCGLLAVVLGLMLGCLSNLEGKYAKALLLMIAILAMLVVISVSCNYSMKNVKTASYFGGVSYFIYLLHEKITNIVYCLWGGKSFVISSIILGVASLVFFWVYRKVLHITYSRN